MSAEQFPSSHVKAKLDSRFSFSSEDSFLSVEDDNADGVVQNSLQAIVANESWYKKPLIVVVVGASGDLAKKKTYPSLFELYQHNLLPPQTIIYGYARSSKTHMELRDHLHPHLQDGILSHAPPSKSLKKFLELCFYHSGKSYGDAEAYGNLVDQVLTTPPFNGGTANVLYYLAVPPDVFHQTVRTLEQVPNAVSPSNTKFVIEKPFGRDLPSCQELLENFEGIPESMLYRIDHYLGKPMVDNIFTLRSANPWLEQMWSKEHVESVMVRFKEPFGTNGRGGYFDNYGIIRDVVQNHLLQVLLLVAMELPSASADDGEKEEENKDVIRQAKVQVLENMPPVKLEDTLLGQYDGYTDDPTIKNKDTNCPTYVALRCSVDSERWKGVPFFMEAGKALDDRIVDVQIKFKGNPPFPSNTLTLQIQPEASMTMTAHMKPLDSVSGAKQAVSTMTMTAPYSAQSDTNDVKPIENAYTRLLLDVMRGNQANFCRADELVKSWELFTPLLHQIERDHVPAATYTYGSAGPPSRTAFFEEKMQPTVKASL